MEWTPVGCCWPIMSSFFAAAAYQPSVVRRSIFSLYRHSSEIEHSRETSHSCRCAQPTSHLHIRGMLDNWFRRCSETRPSHTHGGVGKLSRMGTRAGSFHNAGHARSDTRCVHPSPSRPTASLRIPHNREPLAPGLVLRQFHKRGRSEARSQKTMAARSRQGLSGCVGPESSQHT